MLRTVIFVIFCLLFPLAALAETTVVMLGTGTPIPTPERSGPATAVVVDGQAYLIDAGAGIVRRASAAAEKHNIPALTAGNLDRLFLTHLHSDHTLGYADLIFTPWVMGRRSPLVTVGPKATKAMADNLLEAYSEDIRVRMHGPETMSDDGITMDVRPLKEGEVFKDERVRVEAILVPHGGWEEAYALKFTTSEKTVVISGDAAPSDKLTEFAKGCDILVHEVYLEMPFKMRGAFPRYHKASHTSTTELAELPKKAQPGLLVLYHILDWGFPDKYIIEEIREAGYKGEVVLPSDLDAF